MLNFTAVNSIVHFGIMLVSGFAMQRGFAHLAPEPCARRQMSSTLRRCLLWAMFATVFGIPIWVGDENAVLLFPVFLASIVLCTGGSRLGRLVLGAIFYTLLMPMNLLADSVSRWMQSFYGDSLLRETPLRLLRCAI